jgi:hypothetical protein
VLLLLLLLLLVLLLSQLQLFLQCVAGLPIHWRCGHLFAARARVVIDRRCAACIVLVHAQRHWSAD